MVLDGDGNDSIAITVTAAATMASGTIYGGGGNDSITIAGTGTTNALFVSMNAGADVFTALFLTRLRAPSSEWVLVMT